MILEYLTKKPSYYHSVHNQILFGFTAFYALWCMFVIDARVDHLYFYLLLLTLYISSEKGRSFVLAFMFFIIFWVIYDGLRVFPNYMVNEVHTTAPYELEKSLFGITDNGIRLTFNEYFKIHNHALLDVVTALFYLTWVPIPLTLAIYLFVTDKQMMLKFTAAYLFTNLIGFIIYYSYPAAPPWYFANYGTEVRFDVPANAAGLLRFDQLIKWPLFEGLYTKNSNVFAAIPSLHAAYPVVTWFYGRKNAPKWLKYLIFIDIIGIWFSAVYTFHHYLIDVLIGGLVAMISILIFEKLILKSIFSNFISNFAKFIETNK